MHVSLNYTCTHVFDIFTLVTEWSRTATQQTKKKSSVTRITSFQSSQSNNTSGSSSWLVSDSSDQINGIGKWQTTPDLLEHTADLIFNYWYQELAQTFREELNASFVSDR